MNTTITAASESGLTGHRQLLLKRQAAARILLSALALLLIYGAALYHQPDSVTPDEARLLWIIRDDVKVQPAAPRDLARTVLHNVTVTLDRSREHGIFPVYSLLLKGWSWLAGDFAVMVRLFSAFGLLIGLALAARLLARLLRLPGWMTPLLLLAVGVFPPLLMTARQVNPLTLSLALMLAVVLLLILLLRRVSTLRLPQMQFHTHPVGPALLAVLILVEIAAYPAVIPASPDWHGTITRYRAARDPLHPVVTGFTPDSVAGYYDYADHLRSGIAVDLAWRDFSPGEIQSVLEKLRPGGYPIWIILPADSDLTRQVTDLLSQRYTPDTSDQIDGMLFQRFSLTP